MTVLDLCTDDDRVRRVDLAPALRQRIGMLSDQDRALIELVHLGQVSQRGAARLLNIEPGTVCRRIRRILRRLADPLVRALIDATPPDLDPVDGRIGLAWHLHDRTLADIAAENHLTRYEVRARLAALRGWLKAHKPKS